MSESIKAVNKIVKMDLRIRNSLDKERTMTDIATGEIAKNITQSKICEDKLKTVLSSKININQLIESFSKFNKNLLSIYIPFFIIAELGATACVFHLGSNGIYIINKITAILLSTTLLEIKNGEVSTMVHNLNIMKKLVTDTNNLNKNISQLESIKKRKH